MKCFQAKKEEVVRGWQLVDAAPGGGTGSRSEIAAPARWAGTTPRRGRHCEEPAPAPGAGAGDAAISSRPTRGWGRDQRAAKGVGATWMRRSACGAFGEARPRESGART